ncbi:ATP-grasp domain-containing protein [Allostreptomyces psammosilenae]|uniref:ATP-grasp domain-containing protein n=1 Tax=Allostreptomyces psammosilenae TaxID=1892865 RepID=A0A852ZXA1_9ACTN|nr:hypothetical protein [Allostreptomyces psammosilenae]NYI06829.1 hypothetical protein [Allostreptomyces psammosilenae]
MPAPDVVLVTTRHMPVPAPENEVLLDALTAAGLNAGMWHWDDPEADWAAVPLVLIRTPWDYVDRLPEFLAWARRVAGVTRLRNPLAVVEWNSHKGYLLDLLRAGVPTVPTVLVPRAATAGERAAALGRFPGEVVVKPAVSVGARGTLRTSAGSVQADAHLAALASDGDVLVQPFAPSVTAHGEASLIYFGGRFSHAVRKIPAEGDFRVQMYHGGTVVPHVPDEAELAVAAAALACAPAEPAYARVDLVRLDEGPAVMELELIEPELFLPYEPEATNRFVRVLAGLLAERQGPSQPSGVSQPTGVPGPSAVPDPSAAAGTVGADA